jgi:CBS domain-containing protein
MKTAREVMTAGPVCCTPGTSLDEVAKLMRQNDCGEIPVVDSDERLTGVITDRDIVCRVVAEGRNPSTETAGSYMSSDVVTVDLEVPLDEAVALMERHQIRRVPVVDKTGRCVGIISQADVAWTGKPSEVGEMVREVSRDTVQPSR